MKFKYGDVTISGGFWKNAEDMNKTKTIDAVWNRFYDTGRIDAMKFEWKPGMENEPHEYWDSDVFKWVEGACNIISKGDRDDLKEKIEYVIDNICEHQEPDGYFNTYISVCRPEDRFKDRNLHELYSAGHLFEAAAAHYNATGSDRLVNVAKKYADYIEKVFVIDQSAAFTTPGHQEIELALVKLYELTGIERYLNMAEFFLKKRANNDKDEEICGNIYHVQDYTTPEELDTAIGHAVRCLYMLSGMADCAKYTGNKKLLNACINTYEDIVKTKMYVTGGTGSTRYGEAFTLPYDLPTETAYAETCAAIAFMMFSGRMCNMLKEAKYADTVERAMYNAMMAGISLDGESFFYENPLQITLNKRQRPTVGDHEKFAVTQRQKVFFCSCCPPNINRTLSSMEQYIYNVDNKDVYVNQFMSSNLKSDDISIEQKTNYPANGRVEINAEGVENLYIRIPEWCGDFSLNCDYTEERGYAKVKAKGTVIFEMNMDPFLVGANPCVEACAGKAALQRGPIVYCVEKVDYNDNLNTLYVSNTDGAEVVYDEFFKGHTITLNALKNVTDNGLYMRKCDKFENVKVKFIPYYGFANRGESDMTVWVNYK